MSENKKAQAQLFIIPIAVAVLALIFVVSFLSSWKFRLTITGIALLAVTLIYVLPAWYNAGSKKSGKSLLFTLFAIGLALVLIPNLMQQSVIGVSTVNFENGKAYYLFSGVADSIDEQVSFTLKGTNYTTDSGQIVVPKKSVTVTFSKGESYCDYPYISRSRTLLGLYTINYYTLGNPSNIIKINIKDNNGGSTILDGSQNGATATINDVDGKGSVQIKALGSLASSSKCPEYSNVGLFPSSAGGVKVIYLDSLNSMYDNVLSNVASCSLSTFSLSTQKIINCISDKLQDNTQFTSQFTSYPLAKTGSMTGNKDIGNAMFTMTADQDYFDAVLYTPPTQAKPEISGVYLSNIKDGTTSSVRVDIKNNAQTSGTVLILVSGSNIGISPSSKSIILATQQSVYFDINSIGSKMGSFEVCFNACSTSQFNSNVCDKECKSALVTGDASDISCGNNVCDVNENTASCPSDCKNTNQSNTQCTWYQEPYSSVQKDYGTLSWRHIFNNPIVTPISGCGTAGWVYALIIGSLVGVVIIIIVLINRPIKKRK